MPPRICYGYRLEAYDRKNGEKTVSYYTYSPSSYPFNTVEISGDGDRDLESQINRLNDRKTVEIKLYSYIDGKWEKKIGIVMFRDVMMIRTIVLEVNKNSILNIYKDTIFIILL